MLPGLPHDWAPGICSSREPLPYVIYQIICLVVQACIKEVLCLNCRCERIHIIRAKSISAAISSTLPKCFKEHIKRIGWRAGTTLGSILDELVILNALILVSKQITSVGFVQGECVVPLVVL